MKNEAMVGKYEAVFCIFMGAAAYLWRDNPLLVYPQILYLLAGLMVLNLGAGFSLRFWPKSKWRPALFIAANCGAVSAIVAYSGGAQSNLWVLYLLPVFTACLLLDGLDVFLITAGIAGFNAAFLISRGALWSGGAAFALLIKSGMLAFAAAMTWRLANKDRLTRRNLERERAEVSGLMSRLEDQKERLEQSEPLAELGLWSSGVAHDLASTFMVILSYAEIAGKSSCISADIRGDLEHIRRSALLGTNLTASLSALARRQKEPFGECDVREVLRATLSMLRPMFRAGRVEVGVRESGADFRAAAARTDVQRVVLNLLTNAAKAMKNGGAVSVRLEEDGGPGALPPSVRLTVEDTGPGIPKDVLAKMFTPYQTTRASEGGTGLGLYICRRLALRHGGTITAGNAASGGAKFVVALPRRRSAAVRKEEPAAI